MRFAVGLLRTCLAIAACVTVVTAAPASREAPDEAAATTYDLPFPVGEELHYRIYWGFIYVGSTVMTSEWVERAGRRLLRIRYRTRSNSVLSKIYPVDSVAESLVDPETFLPVRFTKNLREGRHHYHEITHFQHDAGLAHWESLVKDQIDVYEIDEDTRDIISFVYSMRAQEFPIGEEKHFRVMADEKIYDLYAKATRAERVKLKSYGRIASLRIDPTKAEFQGVFIRKGKLIVWISRDPRRLCTRLEVEVPFANVKAILHKVTGPGDDFWVGGGGGGK